MILLFSLIIITSIWCLGIKVVTGEGMLLQSLGKWAEKKYDNGSKWIEPLCYCHWCMPSIHTAVGFFFAWKFGLYEWHWAVLWYYPIAAMGSSLVNGFVWQFHTTKNAQSEYYESKTDNDVTQ